MNDYEHKPGAAEEEKKKNRERLESKVLVDLAEFIVNKEFGAATVQEHERKVAQRSERMRRAPGSSRWKIESFARRMDDLLADQLLAEDDEIGRLQDRLQKAQTREEMEAIAAEIGKPLTTTEIKAIEDKYFKNL